MTARVSRRAVMAALLLLADPVAVRDRDGALSIDFDSTAALRQWLAAAGLDTPDLLTHDYTRQTTGRPYRSLTAWPTWHGWEITAAAVEYCDLAPLDTDTTDALTAVAAA